MTDRADAQRWALTAAVAIVAVLLAAFAAGRARELGRTAAPPFDEIDLATLPALPSPIGDQAFWIGGWVGPRADDRSPATWRTHAAAGVDISMGPLEDRFRRADNAARLAFLDSLRAADLLRPEGSDVPFVFVRDDSLHPDETTRPGWEARIDAIVREYGKARSLAGYFLADEPVPGDLALWAPAARRLRALDPAHPAYVNFVGLRPNEGADRAAAARWRADVAAAIRAGELALFTFDAYPFGPGPERPHFLASLREAARVSQATQRPFGAVLQWTGHGDLRAVTREEALYQATQALAHGASGITWFTYVAPDPNEEPWHWHGGAIAYDGSRTARFDTLAAVNARLRLLAAARGARPMRAVHFGGDLPPGFVADASAVPGIVTVSGGPATLGYSARDDSGAVRYVLANRDRRRARRFTITFAPPTRPVVLDVAAGDAVVVTARSAPGTPEPDPHTSSRSGTP